MANCRDIPPALWAQAREALIRYFASRAGAADAEELAHETLVAVLQREDYEFKGPEDFLKVCYGFARNVHMASRRKLARNTAESVGDVEPSPNPLPGRLEAAELSTFL